MRLITIFIVAGLLVACGKPVDPRQRFELAEAVAAWNVEGRSWPEKDLRQLEYGRHSFNSFCAVCHLSSGEGQQAMGAPALRANPLARGDVAMLTKKILFGSPGSRMPRFERSLDDEQLAAILTYLRNAWGAQSGETVRTVEVASARVAEKHP